MGIRLYVGVAALIVSASIIGACSSGSGGSAAPTSTTSNPDATTIDVTAKSFSFTPNQITVKAGESKTLVLHVKDVGHDFTVDALGIHVAGKGGETVQHTLTFDKPGTYTFYCSVPGHREAGMVGTLTVQ
jgi:uncharacterized cupredoxin-like copper-binding protein